MRLSKTGPWLVVLLTVIPALMWLPFASFVNSVAFFRSIGQVTALVGTSLICINYILSARYKFLEKFFLGLNRMYIIHALIGSIGFTLILFHPVFIILSYAKISLQSAFDLLMPTVSNIPVFLGTAALLLMIVLMVLTLYIKMEYDSWKNTHRWLGLSLVLFSAHALFVGSTLGQNGSLKLYMFVLMLLGIISFAYKQFSKYLKINFWPFTISKVNFDKGVTTIELTPKGKMPKLNPGQFVFMEPNRLGIPKQSHPFSVASSVLDNSLTLAVKSQGDFTETLKLLTPGTEVLVEGPFGVFSYVNFPSYHHIWIAGGIGVTPFLGMLRSLPPDNKATVTFIYTVKTVDEAVFVDDIKAIAAKIPHINFVLWDSKNKGRLSAKEIIALEPQYQQAEIFVCGPPPMMQSLKEQFLKSGVKDSHIHTEEFALN